MLLFLSSLFSLRPGCLRGLWLKSCKTKLLQRCFCFCSAVFRCLSFGYSKSNHPVYYCSPATLAKTLQKVNMKSRWCTPHVVPVSQARVNHFFFCESAKRGKPLQKFRKTFVAGEYESSVVYPSRCSGHSGLSYSFFSAKRGKPLQKFLRKFVAGEYESSAVYPSRWSGHSGSS